MSSIWAVAKQTFAQCVRTKVGAGFIVLLGLSLLATPLLTSNTAIPLADRIRTFLGYSTSIVMIEMALVTVFLAAGSIASDVSQKHIFMLAVKPLARWEYIVGRWLGVVLLDAVLLLLSGAVIYGVAEFYLRPMSAITPNDRRAIETEVFTARDKVSPDLSVMQRYIEDEIRKKVQASQADGSYQNAIAGFLPQAQGNPAIAEKLLLETIRTNITEKTVSVAPNHSLTWLFRNINVQGNERTGGGKTLEVNRELGLLVVGVDKRMVGLLLADHPVRINDIEGRVIRIGPDFFIAQFSLADIGRAGLAGVRKGDDVRIVLSPVIQITFKATAAINPPSGSGLFSAWLIETPPPDDPAANREDEFRDYVQRSDAPGIPATITVSSRVVDKSHRTQVTYLNLPSRTSSYASSVMILPENISVMYPIGSFEGNFARGLTLVLCQLMFIAALATLAGSFLGFPVASLMVFVLLPFTLVRQWINESINGMPAEMGGAIFRAMGYVFNLLLPDLESLTPAGRLVGGENIPLGLTMLGPAGMTLVGTALILALACVVFNRRELARVQV